MDGRLLIGAVLALVLLAFGGFYVALGPHSGDTVPPVTPPPPIAAPANAAGPASVPPPMATAESIEAEFAQSEHAELLALLKKSFPADYAEFVAQAVRRRNEGVPDQAFGQELAESTGAYFKPSVEPGKPCLTLETLHLAIAKLPDGVRRKIYASMFFAGRG
jgi:hypothetical protein